MRTSAIPLALTLLLGACSASTPPPVSPQQVADADFGLRAQNPAFEQGRGPTVCIDEAHGNFHTAGGRYAPFAGLVTSDGYVVKPNTAKFAKEPLARCRVLVIANALAERNQKNWTKPIDPAFTDDEVAAVAEWVKGGGSLFLIVDHMPMPAANQKLADAFGVHFSNGFARIPGVEGPMFFTREGGLLAGHPITNGRNKDEHIGRVATFTGSAFRIDEGGAPILVFGPRVVSDEPEVAWQFPPGTPRVDVKGWLQGATLRSGHGRVAIFGEAAMFTAQLAGPAKEKFGMNAPEAPENAQFLLNVMHWLTGELGT